LKSAYFRFCVLLCVAVQGTLSAQTFPPLARTVTIAPFRSAFEKIERCVKITEFKWIDNWVKPDKQNDLKAKFSGCLAHDVPYGLYRVRGASEMIYFEGICSVDNASTVCIPVVPPDGDRFGGGVQYEFQLEGTNGPADQLWLNIKPLFDKPLFYMGHLGRGRTYLPFPTGLENTVSFDAAGHASVLVEYLDQLVLTVVRDGTAIASAPLKRADRQGVFSYTLTLHKSGLIVTPRAIPPQQPQKGN